MQSAPLGLLVALMMATSASAQSFDFNRAVQTGIQVLNEINSAQQPPRQQRQPQYRSNPARQVQRGAPRLPRAEVAEIQQRLHELGYDPGPIDGVEGPKTRAALRQFELARGLPAQGRLTRESLVVLRAVAAAATESGQDGAAPTANNEGTPEEPGNSKPVSGSADLSLSSEPAQLAQEQGDGYLFVEGRLAVEVSSVAGLRTIELPTPVTPAENLGQALFRLVGPTLRERPLDEGAALRLINAFDEPTRKAIEEEAFERPLSELSLNEQYMFPANSSPFVKRRAANAVRSRIHQLFSIEALEQPVPLRVYCSASLQSYNFATQTFAISKSNCSSRPSVLFPGLRGDTEPVFRLVHEAPPAPQDGFPDAVPIPVHEAEAFDAALPPNRLVLLSYESELFVEVRPSEASPIATVSYAAPRNFVLHPSNRWTEVLYAFGPGKAPSTVSQDDRTWDLYSQDDLGELVSLAAPPRTLPASATSLAAAASERLGFLTLSGGRCLRPSGGQQLEVNPLNRSGSVLLAAALAVPTEHLVSLPSVAGGSSPQLFGLLMQPKHAFSYSAPADLYGEYCLDVELDSELVGAHHFALPDGKSALVLTIIPREGRFLGSSTNSRDHTKQVLERIPFSSVTELPSKETIAVPSRVALLWNLAEHFGIDAVAVIQSDLWRAGVSDAFEQRRRVDELVDAARAENASADRFWLQGTLSLKKYDFDTQSFPVAEITLQTIDVARATDVRNRTLRFELKDPQIMAVAIPPQQAEDFAQDRLRNLPVRMLVRPTRAEVSSYGDLRVRIVVEEAEILAKDATITVVDPAQVLFRYPFESLPEPLEQPPAQALSPEEAEVRLDALLQDVNSQLVMIRRTDSTDITAMLTSNVQPRDYNPVVRQLALNLPESLQYLHASEMAEAFRDDKGAAILAHKSILATQPSPGVAEREDRRHVVSLLTRFDLVLEAFPPDMILGATDASQLGELLPRDVERLFIRRRDDSMQVQKVFLDRTKMAADYLQERSKLSMADRNLEEVRLKIASELPGESSIEGVQLADMPAILSEELGAAVVVTREGFTRIFPQIRDVDLVVRAFPPEEFYVGLRKDNTQEPHEFAVLGIPAGAAAAEAEEAILSEFTSAEVSLDDAGSLMASRGQCGEDHWNEAGSPEEVGSLCLKVRLDQGRASHIILRQVVSGDAGETALKAFRERYRRDPWLREIRHLEKGATRSVYGWGTLLNAQRSALGRVDAKTPPSAFEAMIWVADGVTTIQLQLDAVETLAEAEAARAPDIKF